MKKILTFVILMILLVACSDDNSSNKDITKNVDQNESDTSSNEDIKEYTIGETAIITSDFYGFDYEITVSDFQLTREVDGVKIEDYLSGAVESNRFAVIDVTIKNISDNAYVPNEMFSANFAKETERAGDTDEDQFFTIADEELQPGEEMSGHIVYLLDLDDSQEFRLKYEFFTEEETHFVLPRPAGE
ncbi:DUF4352 domain-containing protein [Paucisalibacillus globulus]|uniref:DUF4352 domain-containing protein n=1 Tax=Paucisalibacillus globulus TaxID=351095 RepID=UPI00040F08C8|nr:DUF4352 domain-containing protein [Paucisalibacillus globulus]